jgi:hypothetical protein
MTHGGDAAATGATVGRLLGDEVPGAGNDQALHVVRDQLHVVRDVIPEARRSADRQDGHGQLPGLALLILVDGLVERPVPAEAAAQ